MHRRELRPFYWLAALLLGWTFGCGRSAERRPNVLLILVDTLRADRLSRYGKLTGLSPAIDTWMEDAQVFRAAFAHAPWTLPSTASLLTSTYPQQHGAGGLVPYKDRQGAVRGGFTALSAGLPTLPERFQAAGYQSAAIVNVDFLGRSFGLTRGFEHVDEVFYADNEHVRDAEATTDAALRWLDQSGAQPKFLLVHYFDVHAAYAPPPQFRKAHALPEDQEDDSFRFPTREQMVLLRQGQLELDRQTIARAEALYNGEVAYVDQQIGRLLLGLRQRELSQNTIVVLTSDHGEEFLEHGGFEHGHTLYDELLHVPLAISWPGKIPPGESQAMVGLIDIAPTLCHLADIAPAESFLGTSLVGLWQGKELPERALLAHGNFWGPALSSLRHKSDKLILGPLLEGNQRAQALFDWRADPGELRSRSAAEPELCRHLRERLFETERILEAHQGSEVELDAEAFQRLKEQGYVGGEDGH